MVFFFPYRLPISSWSPIALSVLWPSYPEPIIHDMHNYLRISPSQKNLSPTKKVFINGTISQGTGPGSPTLDPSTVQVPASTSTVLLHSVVIGQVQGLEEQDRTAVSQMSKQISVFWSKITFQMPVSFVLISDIVKLVLSAATTSVKSHLGTVAPAHSV